LQREGLRDGETWELLHLKEDQRKQFMGLIMQAHQKIQQLLEEAQKTGNLKEVQGKVIKIRDDLEDDLCAKLTDDQKMQWKEMLGKLTDPAALFDL
jgi:predicted HAD superfamily Cof-like phosphohydrolase